MLLAALLNGLRVAILVANGFEQSEMVEPKKALEAEGALVHIVSPVEGKVQGWDWVALRPLDEFTVDASIKSVDPTDYDALVLPGGLNSPDDLRLDEPSVAFVRAFHSKPIASICHGQWTLINAGLVKDKIVTSWPSIQVDLVNAGARWVDRPVVRDGYLLTSRMPDDIPLFNRAMIELFSEIPKKKHSP